MSDCCTPLYVRVPFLSPTGNIRLKRETGNAPSCGYYDNYTGTPEFGNYDYHTVDLQYNSGSGFWTFSGNSTGFNDPTIYRSSHTGEPCNPIGTYTGGIYDPLTIQSDPFGLFPIYDFEPNFEYETGDSFAPSKGSGIHLNRDVKFKFSFKDQFGKNIRTPKDMSRSIYFDGVAYDVLHIDGRVASKDYITGYTTEVLITEETNKQIFGYYEPNFGIKARTKDKLIGEGGSSELYTYGNKLYITAVEAQDDSGTSSYQVDEGGASTTGAVPSGRVEDKLIIKSKFENNPQYVNPSHIDIYASTGENIEYTTSNLVGSKVLNRNSAATNIEINKSLQIKPNTEYWFGLVGHSKLGSGNLVKIGPHKIYEKEQGDSAIVSNTFQLSYKDASTSDKFRTGVLTGEITGNSGVVDKLLVYKESLGSVVGIYDGPNFLFNTLPTNPSGQWLNTTFDYSFEFKDSTDPYKNIAKNIKLNATGTSIDPLNSGMPLFQLTDYNTGQAVELAVNYTESGLYLVSNTGHDYNNFKYSRKAF